MFRRFVVGVVGFHSVLAAVLFAGLTNTASAGRAVKLHDHAEPRFPKPVSRPVVNSQSAPRIYPPIVRPGSRYYYVPPQLWGPLGPPPGYYGNNYGSSSTYDRYRYLPGAGIGFGPGAIFNW